MMQTMPTATTQPTASSTARVPPVRNPKLDFKGTGIPKYWLRNNTFESLRSNAVNLLFPAGEHFFVRSVRRYMKQIDDPILLAQVRGFAGQEGSHAREHERFFETMRAQGYKIDTILKVFEQVAFKMIEPLAPDELKLATTAACEHFTALMAEDGLRTEILTGAHDTMRNLLQWHAVEELEHKAVAFDVLQVVNPSYRLRMAGMAAATGLLGSFWLLAFLSLAVQEGPGAIGRMAIEKKKSDRPSVARGVFLRGILEYLRRDFHPNDKDTEQLVADYLKASGLSPLAPG